MTIHFLVLEEAFSIYYGQDITIHFMRKIVNR